MTKARLGPLFIGPHKIDRPIILAPMSGVSESPFRIIALEMGAGLAPTELISSNGLVYKNARTEGYLARDQKREPVFCVQLFGGDPQAMATAAERVVEAGADIIDLNMGCPVKKVTKSGAGSALMLDEARAQAIVSAIRERVGERIPVTAKIRAGWDAPTAVRFGRALEDAGVAAIAIHGRTRAQGYSGRADWSLIRDLVGAVSVPVIANGDIEDRKSAEAVIEATGCAGIMIGRAALGNPWIFRALAAPYKEGEDAGAPSKDERADMVKRHLVAHLEHIGDETRAIRRFRQHLIWYSRGLVGGAQFRERAVQIERTDEALDEIDAFFRTALEGKREQAIYDERAALG